MSKSSTVAFRTFVESMLPLNDALFRESMSQHDELDLVAVAGGAFSALVRENPEVFHDRSRRLALGVEVSEADMFEGRVPVWMVEAAFQGALGSAIAIDGVPADLLVEIHVVSLKVLSVRLVTSENRSRLLADATTIAERVRAELAAMEDHRPGPATT